MLREADVEFFQGNALVVKDPYLSYALVAQLLDTTPAAATEIAASAFVDPTATLGNNVAIGHNAVIEAGVTLGNNVQIGAGCFIGKNAVIGDNTNYGRMSLFITMLS